LSIFSQDQKFKNDHLPRQSRDKNAREIMTEKWCVLQDGKSIVPLLFDADAPGLPAQTKAHVKAMAPSGKEAFAKGWRDSVFIECVPTKKSSFDCRRFRTCANVQARSHAIVSIRKDLDRSLHEFEFVAG
jgi:hypothetical protein